MPEEILKNIYRIPVPLPGNPLKELNTYLIKGSERNILIDTGFRQQPCREALFTGLRELGVSPDSTDVLLTHMHSDHSGLAPEVAGERGCIYVSGPDRAILESITGNRSRPIDTLYLAEGFAPELVAQINTSNPIRSMAPPESHSYVTIEDGQVLEVGGYKLQCILVPGHTPGQMCFWMEREGAMFLGDHVLFDITPNITSWSNVEDSLGNYLQSLKKIREYPVALPLPAHRGRAAFQPRIDALLEHHRRRLDEAFQAVRNHPALAAYDLAQYMTWKIHSDSWETFPLTQKWFAVGECMAHLDYLTVRGLVRREVDEAGVRHYFVP